MARLFALLERVADDVAELKGRAKPSTTLLSFRAAAKLLGVARGTTLQALIDSGQLPVVTVKGRRRIARAEVERLAASGFDGHAPRRARSRATVRRDVGAVASEILKLKI